MTNFSYNFHFCPECGGEGTVTKHDMTRYSCSQCGMEFWNNPKGAVAVVIIKDGQVLLAERGREPPVGKLDLPGGYLEYNEDPYAAAVREVREETGLTILDPQFVYTRTHGFDTGITTVDLVFVARKWEGQALPHDDVASLTWQPLGCLDSDAMAFRWPGLTHALAAHARASAAP